MLSINILNHHHLIKDTLMMAGLAENQAKVTSDIMGYADLRGIDSHGIILLNTYISRLKNRIINKNPNIKYEMKGPNILKIDADHSIGHYIAKIAMERAISIAKENSIGVVFVKNATHYGASSYYSELASENQMFGFTTTNTMPLMAPTGGKEKVLGNNPISMSIPGPAKNPVTLDIATSIVAAGKLVLANQRNEKIPTGWAMDKNGNHTNDPHEGFEGGGTLLPIADHKGYGLSFFMDVLAGILSGGKYGKDVGHSDIGFTMVALNLNVLMNDEELENSIENLTKMIKESNRVSESNTIFLPGEIELLRKKDRYKNGIPINKKQFLELKNLLSTFKLSIEDYINN